MSELYAARLALLTADRHIKALRKQKDEHRPLYRFPTENEAAFFAEQVRLAEESQRIPSCADRAAAERRDAAVRELLEAERATPILGWRKYDRLRAAFATLRELP